MTQTRKKNAAKSKNSTQAAATTKKAKPKAAASSKKATAKPSKTKTASQKISVTASSKANALTKTAKETNQKFVKVSYNAEDIMTNTKMQFDQFTESAAGINEAVTQSSTIAAKGIENIMKTCFDLMQHNSERQATMMKKFMECRNINDFTELQTKLAQQNFDEFMSGATKISELSVKCATETFDPINDQINKTIKKATAA